MPIGGGGLNYAGMANSAMQANAGMTSGAGGVLSALGAGGGDYSVLRLPKNRTVAKDNNLLLGDWAANRTAGQSALGDYIAKYLAGTRDAEMRTGQETRAMDRFYNGGAETELMALRNARSAAVNEAAQRAMAYARAGLNRSRLTGQGGPSTYDDLLAQRTMADITSRAAVDEADQARRDWEYITGNQIGMAGRRTSLDDALASRSLVPDSVRRQMLESDARSLAGLSNIDLANTFYGVEYDPSDLEKAGSVLSAAGAGMSSMTGGGGGGGGGGL